MFFLLNLEREAERENLFNDALCVKDLRLPPTKPQRGLTVTFLAGSVGQMFLKGGWGIVLEQRTLTQLNSELTTKQNVNNTGTKKVSIMK
jgi:hypothetical protein